MYVETEDGTIVMIGTIESIKKTKSGLVVITGVSGEKYACEPKSPDAFVSNVLKQIGESHV